MRANFARALHEIEYRCLCAMEETLKKKNIEVDAYLHDGMMVRAAAPLGADVLHELEQAMYEQVGVRARLTDS